MHHQKLLKILSLFITTALLWYTRSPLLSTAVFFGLMMGFALQRSRICMAAALRDIFLFKSFYVARAVALIILLSSLGFTAYQYMLFSRTGSIPGIIKPAGIYTIAGGLLFGIGMVLSGNCILITLVRVGEGHTQQLFTLAGVLVGSALGLYHFGWWMGYGAYSQLKLALPQLVSWPGAVLLQITLLLALFIAVSLAEHRRSSLSAATMTAATASSSLPAKLFRPWPMLAGAVVIAAINVAWFLVHGYPWSVAKPFSFIVVPLAKLINVDLSTSFFFASTRCRELLNLGIREYHELFLNIGTVLGAFLAALFSNEFRIRRIPSWRNVFSVFTGGILMGYGARIAMGCTMGALVNGISSMSLHGYLFLPALLAGAWLGTKLLTSLVISS